MKPKQKGPATGGAVTGPDEIEQYGNYSTGNEKQKQPKCNRRILEGLEISNLPQWVVWVEEIKGERKSKVPVNPKTGANASVSNPQTWATLSEALEVFDYGYDGVGFVFTEYSNVTGLDFDKCRDPKTGTLDPEVEKVVKQLNSYTEVSPSGTGIHTLLYGKLPPGSRHVGKREAYDQSRYFTMTGQHLAGTPCSIQPRQTELNEIYEKLFLQPNLSSQISKGCSQDNDQLGKNSSCEEERDQGQTLNKTGGIEQLWSGDWSQYESPSQADLALCTKLAFITKGDREQTDFFFRQSGLMRAKWDETHYSNGRTYGVGTVEKAVTSFSQATVVRCHEFVDHALDIEVIGSTSGPKIFLRHRPSRRIETYSVDEINTARLSCFTNIHVGKALVDAKLNISSVKDAIAQKAHHLVLDSLTIRGTGIYRAKEDLLIVNGNDAFQWDGERKIPIKSLIYDRFIFDLKPSHVLHPELDELLRCVKLSTSEECSESWSGLVEFFNHWNWITPYAQELLAGQLVATVLQTMWPWKSHSYLCAKRNSGKTTLLDLLKTILGPLGLSFSSHASEAGIRQTSGNRGHYLLIDEFEKSRERDKILKLFRQANQGGEVVKGTPSGDPLIFWINCLVWIASIEHGLESAADSSRFLLFELNPVTSEQKTKGLPSEKDLHDIGDWVYILALKEFRRFWSICDSLRRIPIAGLDTRMVDSLAVPVSIWAFFEGRDPESLLLQVAKPWKSKMNEEIVEDEFALLRDILQFVFTPVGSSTIAERRTIGECLNEDHFAQDLAAFGFKRTKSDGQNVVAFLPEAVRRNTLRNTKWETLNIRDLLRRVPGAKRTRLRMAGMANARVVIIPLRVIENLRA